MLLGVGPALATGFLATALATSQHGWGSVLASGFQQSSHAWWGLTLTGGSARFAPVGVAIVLLGGLWLGVLVSRAGGAKRRRAEPWLCGYVRQSEHNRYRAHGYYGEIKRWFRWLGGGAGKTLGGGHAVMAGAEKQDGVVHRTNGT